MASTAGTGFFYTTKKNPQNTPVSNEGEWGREGGAEEIGTEKEMMEEGREREKDVAATQNLSS